MIIQTLTCVFRYHFADSFCSCRERHKLGDLLVFVQLLQRVEPLGEYRVWRKAMHSRMAVSAQTHAVPMQKFTCERLWAPARSQELPRRRLREGCHASDTWHESLLG